MLKIKDFCNLMLMLFLAAAAFLPLSTAVADDKIGFKVAKQDSNSLQYARADRWRFVGRTVFLEGNVYIPYGNLTITADAAMVDLESRDVEAKGNVKFVTADKSPQLVTIDELQRLQELTDVYVEITGIRVDPLGRQQIEINLFRRNGEIESDRLSGNLLSGMITFSDLRLRTNSFACKAKRGVRQPGGELKLEELEISNCEYIFEDNSHLSVSMKRANLYPHQTEGFGFSNAEKQRNEYSFWGYNSMLRIYGVPVFWLPMVYTPKDESPGLFTTRIGYNSDWGFHVLMSKKFQLMDYPSVTTALDLDLYAKRGIGVGERTKVVTENSLTELNAYGIYDIEPYESSGDEDDGRFKIPHSRFDFQLAHRTHLTPRLDFRGQVEWMSDAYMLDDYFQERADDIPEPASYVALEYQGDRFSTALYTRFQVNDFYTTVLKLPELRLDLPRQEILREMGLYYQGSQTASYMRMNWARFDRDWKNPFSRLRNYQTGRFDSVNFLYYPIRMRYLNVVPRAGLRMTGYSNSSRTKIKQSDIFMMQAALDEEKDYGLPVRNYNDHGDGKFRLIGEIGVEANTKIYNTWQNVRSEFLELDGLRHICEPYVNYTFITDPTVNRDKLLFFDDVDRISELHFIRFGLRNRLQTRRGGFHDARIHQWFEMENYWDLYINSDDDYDYNNIGDFCTKITFSPSEEFRVVSFMSVDAGNNQTHDVQAVRGNRLAGRPHISGNFFNQLYVALEYRPIEDFLISLAYRYRDAYIGRAAYSMGSTLTELDSGSLFDQYFIPNRLQAFEFSLVAPLTADRKTFGGYKLAYDLEDGGFSEQTLMISRVFHCVKLGALVRFERSRDDNDVKYETSFEVQCTLTQMDSPMQKVRRQRVSQFTGLK